MADTVRDMLGPHPAVRQLRALRAQIERQQSEYQECLTGWTPTWRPAAGLRKRPRGRGTSASGRTEGRDDE